jgi:hypothetical protein
MAISCEGTGCHHREEKSHTKISPRKTTHKKIGPKISPPKLHRGPSSEIRRLICCPQKQPCFSAGRFSACCLHSGPEHHRLGQICVGHFGGGCEGEGFRRLDPYEPGEVREVDGVWGDAVANQGGVSGGEPGCVADLGV